MQKKCDMREKKVRQMKMKGNKAKMGVAIKERTKRLERNLGPV